MAVEMRAPIKTNMEIYLLSHSKVIFMITGPNTVTSSFFRKFYPANVRSVFFFSVIIDSSTL